MKIHFFKGKENVITSPIYSNEEEYKNSVKKIRDSFLQILDNKNLSFLLGSGCSSYKTSETGWEEIGIPVMIPLAKEFFESIDFEEEKEWLLRELKLNATDEEHFSNLENFLSTLYNVRFYLNKKIKTEDKANNPTVTEINTVKAEVSEFENLDEIGKIQYIIKKVRNFILLKCLNEKTDDIDLPLRNVYKEFYKKLLTRNSTLPRLNIFTTNYDLYSENAMDSLGINYCNGFTGGITKYFNPAIFNYALAERMDLSLSKWSVIDNFFYLYKLHGSVNWIEAEIDSKLFKVHELQSPEFRNLKEENTIMIFPTPLKYNDSLGSPYSDLFREFQKKLMVNNNILITIGYSFNDEHINNLIFQAFTLPSFRLVIIGDPSSSSAIKKLLDLNDSRIWIIGEEVEKELNENVPLHYFKNFVEKILPVFNAEDLDSKMESTFKKLQLVFNDN